MVILASGRDFDGLGFNVLRDYANLFTVKLFAGIARERSRGGDHQHRRARNARSCGRLGMRLNFKAAVGGKEARQVSGERMLELARGTQLAKVAELFFYFGIERPQ